MARLSSFCGDIKELVSLKIKRVVSAYSVFVDPTIPSHKTAINTLALIFDHYFPALISQELY